MFGGGIWNMLCEELGLTPEQQRQLVGMRSEVILQRQNVSECLRLLADLGTRVKQNISSMTSQMSRIMSITRPMQQAKFLLWLERNQPAVLALNTVWASRNLTPQGE